MSSAAPGQPRRHEADVLRTLRETGPLRRTELATKLGLKRTTLSEATAHLIASGAIHLIDDRRRRPGRGRPAQLLCLDPDAGQYLGMDFGHERVHLVVVNANHEVIASGSDAYPDSSSLTERLDIAFALVDALVAQTGTSLAALRGVGVGVPGPYADALVTERRSPTAGARPWGAGADWKRAMQQRVQYRFGTDAIVDNNVRLAGLAEACWGRTSASDNSIYLKLSDGVGGGIVIGQRPLIGENGFGGELGHITVDANGAPCRCGKRGCLETVAAVWGVLRTARDLGLPARSLADLRAEVDRVNPAADAVAARVGAAVGRVLGMVSVALNPSEIVVGGEVVEALPAVLRHAEAAIQAELLPVNETRPTVRPTRLGDKAGALGAVTALLYATRHHTGRS